MSKSKVEGLGKWEKWVNTLPIKVAKRTKEAVAESGLKVETDAKWNAPVDLGRLEDSISHEIINSGYTAEVFTDIEYALAVELGTMYQEAQPYMIPAFNKEYKKFQAKLKKINEGMVD
ncbi:MAG: HK97-gp10 family putative phage morphogenesis protein [Carnobacterium sp.]|uniref:HK97-gp10 family putative phage morphogenesis protein n=1 Tax=Carnobacterium sp. TaxID=48221 RepID=UPI003C75D085